MGSTDFGEVKTIVNTKPAVVISAINVKNRGGRVCLDSLKQFLSDKLLCLMPLPAAAVV